MITQAPPRPKRPPQPRRPVAEYRPKRRIPRLLLGPAIIGLVVLLMYLGIRAAYGGFGHYYYVSVDMPRAGQQLASGDDVRERGVVIGKISQIRLVGEHVQM